MSSTDVPRITTPLHASIDFIKSICLLNFVPNKLYVLHKSVLLVRNLVCIFYSTIVYLVRLCLPSEQWILVLI